MGVHQFGKIPFHWVTKQYLLLAVNLPEHFIRGQFLGSPRPRRGTLYDQERFLIMGLFGKSRYQKQCEEFERQQAESRRQLEMTRAQQEEFERQQVETQRQLEITCAQQEQFERQQAEGQRQLEIKREQLEETQRQLERHRAYEQQAQRQQTEGWRQLEAASRLLELGQNNAERTSQLLKRCEDISQRFEALLSRLESREGG
jgi:hypothetical protein